MSTERDVGIVMPVYMQRSSYLKEAIRSVLNQSYKNFRLVIVLDGAPQNVAKIVYNEVKGDRRVRVIKQSVNQGVSVALNRGFDWLQHQKDVRYLTWVSSDNVYYSDFIQVLRYRLRHAPQNVGLVYSSFVHVNAKRQAVYDENFRAEFMTWQRQPKEALLDTCFIGTSFMYKREYASRIGGYTLQPIEDYDYWLRLTEQCDIYFVPKVLMEYRVASKYSVSKMLSSSKDQHRRWRHAFHTAKYQARMRRGIATETTVLIPLWEISNDVIRRCEHLYEQFYSNFSIYVLDGTANQGATAQLSQISDPRVAFIPMPRHFTDAHILEVAKRVPTPYVLKYNAMSSENRGDLQALTTTLRSTNTTSAGVSLDVSNGITEFAAYTPGAAMQYGVLYKTSAI